MTPTLDLDAVILGGGAAGLWTLDELSRAGHRVLLLEAKALGHGQTIASQGIIHGGLKYTLGGLLTRSAHSIRDLPLHWRRCLAGEMEPDLSAVRRRAEFCYLWETESLRSRMGMIGARAGLRIAPRTLDRHEWPAPLARGTGTVARLDEQVIEPDGFLAALADRWRDRVLAVDAASGMEIQTDGPGLVRAVRLLNPTTGEPLDLRPRSLVLTAGAGNAALLGAVGLARPAMQRRPLHMVVVAGDLPVFNGHCVDGMRTRATITGSRDATERTLWQVGGEIAESGVDHDRDDQIRRARDELTTILPAVDFSRAQWTTYRVDRAEARTAGTRRPADAYVGREGSCIVAWPTKLVLAPVVAERILGKLPPPSPGPDIDGDILAGWPRPPVAVPPWEDSVSWTNDASVAPISA